MTSSAYEPTDVVVVGGGLAGLSAAYQAAKRGASVICLEANAYGGLIASVAKVDDLVLAPDQTGAGVADAYVRSGVEAGVEFKNAEVVDIAVEAQGNLRLTTSQGAVFARTVILASGARMRKLGLPMEDELFKRGVSDCAWCDGGLYKGKPVAVVGGGDSALQAALYLASIVSRVLVCVRGDSLSAKRHYVLRAADEAKIEFLWETEIESFVGREFVQGIATRARDGTVAELPCECVFVYAGLEPALPGVTLERDASGYVVTNARFGTSMPNVFAAGAIRSGYSGGVDVAIGEGAAAAAMATASLAEA